MGYKLLIVCVVLINHIADNKYLCANVHQKNCKAAHDSDILLETSVLTRRGYAGGKNENTPGGDMIVERTGSLEMILNYILQSQIEIQQNQNNIMHEFTKSEEEINHMSRVLRNPAFCICENKDADQLRGNREADQRLCFRYTDTAIPLLPESEISSLLTSSAVAQFGLCRTWSETPKTGFLTTRLILD